MKIYFIKPTYIPLLDLHQNVKIQHCKYCKKGHREHLISCQGVKLFLLKYITITTVTTATVTTVPITTVTTWVFEFCHNLFFLVLSKFDFLSFVKIWVFEFCQKKFFCSFVTIWILCLVTISVFEFWHNLSF